MKDQSNKIARNSKVKRSCNLAGAENWLILGNHILIMEDLKIAIHSKYTPGIMLLSSLSNCQGICDLTDCEIRGYSH